MEGVREEGVREGGREGGKSRSIWCDSTLAICLDTWTPLRLNNCEVSVCREPR